jgi:Flp pilus assembly protein TadB
LIYILILLLAVSIFLFVFAVLLRNITSEKHNKEARKRFVKLDKLIENSGVLLTVKFYSGLLHVAVSVVCFLLTYSISRNILGSVSSLIFSVLIALFPSVILNILENNKISKTRKEALNFIDIFSNQMIVEENIFEAMRECISFINNPIKDVIRKTLDMYDKRINPLKCIDYIIHNLPGLEVKSFFDTLKYYFIEGGDISSINDEFLIELNDLVEIDQKESSEDHMMYISIYVMIALNLLIIFMTLKSDVSKLITHTLYGEVALSINLSICLSIIAKTLTKSGDIS